MAKAMRVPVLVIENKDEVNLLLKGLHLIEKAKAADEIKIQELMNEIQKIKTIIETTNVR
tara:strand:+ start:121 stop:300 length:180 start_codon:yes stop_codon:yes gene_type:complete